MRIAFKEWAIIVDSLGQGEQILILRKGGIAEGNGGFHVGHQSFLLFPTLFHQQRDCVTPAAQTRFDELKPTFPSADRVRVEFVASVASWWKLASLEEARQLKGLHIWRDDVIEKRFNWGREESIYALALRVLRLPLPLDLPNLPAYGGCKSWVEFAEEVPVDGAKPVLTDGAFARKKSNLIHRLGSGTS